MKKIWLILLLIFGVCFNANAQHFGDQQTIKPIKATDLDIRPLDPAQDSVEVVQDTAADLNATVVATDLDIRDLDASQDNVSISDGTNTLNIDANENIGSVNFHADGTEGSLISGVNYESGKSGVDGSTEVLTTITYAHHEIHSGSHFFTGNYLDLANGQVYDILWVTPNTLEYAHMVFEIATEAEAMFNYYEGVTASANGTALDMFDRNRTTDNTASVTFYHTPTVTNVGTEIGAGIFGSGKQQGGSLRDSNEFVLKPNTKYRMRVTNNTVSANWYDWFFDWYEHTDKN